MATYPHDYTQADEQATDGYGTHIRVIHNLNKDQPHVSVWKKFGTTKFLDTAASVRYVSNNEVRIYTAHYGAAYALDVRVSD